MKECDLIMKGGLTSGVVYPYAITKLAAEYRLKNIGGASAGAIGAVLAAAAEYRRQSGDDMAGFEELEDVAEEIGDVLLKLFQPAPALRPLFKMLLANLRAKSRRGKFLAMFGAATVAFWLEFFVPLLIGLAVSFWAFSQGDVALGFLAILSGFVLASAMLAYSLYQMVFVTLPKHNFGLCPGKTMEGYGDTPGFTDWIAEKIEKTAGNSRALDNGAKDDTEEDYLPLTIGALGEKGIEVATMTTDLSSSRPYQLPLKTEHHFFSKAEFEALFSEQLVEYLCKKGKKRETRTSDKGVPDDLYQLPTGKDFPLLLVARMSLSFPGLIQAVPIWRVDYLSDGAPMRRCLFSDGGISSNFPIHFFDALLPSRPTFGISLTSLEKYHKDQRIDLPEEAPQSTNLPIAKIDSLGKFLMSIVNTAKDWQDTMQSRLPGYAERIVSVRLDEEKEGGMHLNMPSKVVDDLTRYGKMAGETLLKDFDFNQHRYNRAISVLPAMAHELVDMAETYHTEPTKFARGYSDILQNLDLQVYTGSAKKWRRETLDRFASELAAFGKQEFSTNLNLSFEYPKMGGYVPSTDSKIRLVAEADRDPRKARE